MSDPQTSQSLALYATPPHPCGYLPEIEATTVFADPLTPKSKSLYSVLAREGFRRSGEHIYRPYCPDCQACIPIRLPVAEFRLRRNQKRTWMANQDLRVIVTPPLFKEEHFLLYQRYIAARHRGGGMDNPDRKHFMEFLTSSWSDTVFFEFRMGGSLLAVAVVDRLNGALSAVYTFFDPEHGHRSLGRLAVLFEIKEARKQGLQWLYLGYWIKGCRKMQYKNEYQPLEYYINGHWTRRQNLCE
jgi:arginine-tRNA-protein transferase